MSITTFNIRGRCFVCEGRFVDPYSLVCYKDQCRGRVICGSCLGIANDACRVGMKCSICRINSIVSIVPVESVEATSQDEITCNNSAAKEQSPPQRNAASSSDGCKGIAKKWCCRSNKACGKYISVRIPCIFNGQVCKAWQCLKKSKHLCQKSTRSSQYTRTLMRLKQT